MRDPKLDPQPGDIWRRGEVSIIVHTVTSATVYFGRLSPDVEPMLGGGCMRRSDFTERVSAADVEFVRKGEL